MKYIKTLEIWKYGKQDFITPEIGDYVIINAEPGSGIPEYYGDNIGKITAILNTLIYVNYGENLEPLKYIHESWIKYISKNKKELELKLAANKYNI